MTSNRHWLLRRGLERVFLLLAGVVLVLIFLDLFSVLRRDFAEVPRRLQDGSMVNLNADKPAERLGNLLEKGFYLEDVRDIAYIRSVLTQQLTGEEKIDNIGELNKSRYDVLAEDAFLRGGDSYKKRVQLSRALLGFSGPDSVRFAQERNAPPGLPSSLSIGSGGHDIKGTIKNAGGDGVGGVLVRLELVLPQDSLYGSVTQADREATENAKGIRRTYTLDSAGNRQLTSLAAYVRTDADGDFAFTELPDKKAFEVLPLQPGFQFGSSQGTAELNNDLSLNFRQSPHRIKLFSTKDFNNLKKEKALIVRLPAEASRWFWIILGVFLGSFLVVHLFLSAKFPQADQLILPAVMLLTGFSLITLFSLQDPLRDRFLARSTISYFGGGMLLICVLLLFNLRRFTVDSGLFRLFAFKNDRRAAAGWQWAGVAMLLLLLTIVFGTGPEGSGVKVNLFGFQPSEMVKFFILIFLAGFFTLNEKFISEYVRWQKRWAFFSFALIAIVLTILLFLALGDLGPAMVVCFSFIILFSFSRGDFAYAIGTVILYVLLLWVLGNVWLATGITVLAIFLSMQFGRKQLSESSIMALVVMASFLLLDQIPFLDQVFEGPMQRLVDRKSIWQDAWNNEVFGGDHVANGIWGMASGGLTGQGAGEGFAKTIPEAHTDMILPSWGEEFGLTGIICIFILFLIYLHRSIIIGRQTGTPFLFYLCAGIGVSTFVQFLLIAGGSTGALPLSGVSLPFMSYGGSSLIINLVAAGFLLSASNARGTAVQMKYITKQQDRNLMPALVAACAGILLLGVNVSRYLFKNNKWVVQPALVADRSGARMFSYNPRINILMNRLQAGTLYDRKGQLLATSKPEQVTAARDTLAKAGLERYKMDALAHKRLDRYYPFAEHMFFWTGDANTGIFNGGTNGYFAEYEHAAELRGFQMPMVNYDVTASRFREDRFLPRAAREMTVTRRDYSALAPLLLAGINSRQVEEFKKRNRDVQLSLDARLQTSIQQSLQMDPLLKNNRVSVVIMEDSTGDVLASAMYPLPPVQDWELMNISAAEQNRLGTWITTSDLGFTYATQPGSTAKIITAMAAFNKMGPAAAQRSFLIREQDRIRVSGEEPDETGTIRMERAVVKSNNPYFIRLANEENLEEEMANLYMQAGLFLRGVGGYYYGARPDPYRQDKWREFWRSNEFRSKDRYDKNDIRATRGRGVSGMAWGQGELIATPASIARMAAGISNNGFLVSNRYVLRISDSLLPVKDSIQIAKQPQYADMLTSYMISQSRGKVGTLGISVAGKTGTPERIVKKKRINDGWYVFFAPKKTGPGHIVVCVRIEGTKGSSVAVKMAGTHIVPKLLEYGYVKGFGEKAEGGGTRD